MDTPSGGGKQFDYHHLISENNTGDVPDALVEEEVILENNVQGEEQGQEQQQQQLALQQQQQQSLIVKQQQQQSQQKSQQLQQHLTQQQQYLQQKQTMLQNQKRGIQQAQSRKQPAQQKMLYTVVHSGNQHQQQVLVSNKSVRQPGPQQNQSVVKTSSQMQKINKNNVVLEGGGQYEEGQAYVIRDRYGNARTMLWQNGEFHPFDKDKGILIQHSVIDSSQRGRGARGGRGRGRGRGQGQCYGNATGVHMSPNVRGSSPMINNGVRQTKFNTPVPTCRPQLNYMRQTLMQQVGHPSNQQLRQLSSPGNVIHTSPGTPNVPIISVVTSPGLQGQVVQQRPKLPLQNLMPAAQIKSKPTDEASSEYKWSMDLGLFANEQYQSILDQLQNENGHSLPSMAEKMALSNKTAVCKYLLEQNKNDKRTYCKEFVDILKKCSSIPAREDIILVELCALYNYVFYHTEVVCSVDEPGLGTDIYCQVYKTFSRVLRTVSPQKRKGDFLQYSDTKTACYSLFDDVLEKLQYGIGKESLSLHVCQCIVILSVREIMTEYNSTIVNLLERVRNILQCMDTTSVHPQQTFILPLRVEHSSLSLADRDQILDIVSFLMTVCHCKEQSWEEVCKSVEGISTATVKCVAQFLSGFALYKSGRYTEGISCLMEVLRSGDALTQRLKARIYNLIGKCFDKLEKYQLSIQMFKEALCADFSYLVPLYNTSLQYKKQKIADMELECLNLLVTALEMRDDRGIQYEGIDLMCLLDTEDADIPYVKALYSLSSRSMQLKRYDVAVEKYMSLLEHLKTWKTDKKEITSIPPLLQVHHEAIEALLMAQKYEECVTLCDRVLMCYNSNTSHLEYSALSQTFDPLLSQTFDQTLDQSLLTKSQGSCNESGRTVGKRKFNELSQSQSDAEHYGDVDVIALKFKAAALVKMGDNSGCLVCLQRAIDSISSYRKFRLQQSMRDVSDSSGKPSRKRLRIDADVKNASKDSITASCDQVISKNSAREVTHSSQSVSEKGNVIKGLFNDSSKMLELEQELYTMTSEILESMEKSRDALHYNRLATQIQNIKEKV